MGWTLAVGMSLAGSLASAQVVERDIKVTGPRGRSIERHVQAARRPGAIDREVRVQRPGGTIERDVHLRSMGGFAPRHHASPRVIERDFYVRRPPVVVERNVYVGRGPALGIAPIFSFMFGSPPPPPPPVVVVPEPVYVEPAPPPVVVYQPPQRYVPAPPQQTVVVDPVASAAERLQSHHDNSRRDGAITLGRLGDPRAVPALMDRLENDDEKEVRMAAAWALAEIGDPRAGASLQKAALFDKREEVREVASRSYARLPRESYPAPTATANQAPAPRDGDAYRASTSDPLPDFVNQP